MPRRTMLVLVALAAAISLPAQTNRLTFADALTLAAESYPQRTVFEIELDERADGSMYEVTFFDGLEVIVDSSDGSMRESRDRDRDDRRSRRVAQNADGVRRVTELTDAIVRAQELVADGQLREVGYAVEERTPVVEVSFQGGAEVSFRLDDGSLFEIDRSWDND